MTGGLKQRSLRALLWSGGESFGQVALSLLTFLVMARALEPQDFGIVALAGVFVFFFNLLASLGFADALVQRSHLDAEHLDTAFWSTLGISLTLMTICLLGADPIGSWLDEPELAAVLRWLSLSIPLGALSGVQLAMMRRDIRFRELSLLRLTGRTAGAVTGLGMLAAGFGVWSLVGQQLAGVLITTVAAIAASRWRPGFRLALSHFRHLWGFGMYASSSQILIAVSEQALTLLIGSIVGATALGYFTIALRMVDLIRSVIASAVHNVAFAAFSRLQDDRARMRQAYRQSTRISCLFGFPIAAGMIALAEPLVLTLFGSKWAVSIPLLQILTTTMFFAFFTMFFAALYSALGRADIGMYLAGTVLVLGVAGVGMGAQYGLVAVAVVWVGRLLLILPAVVALASRLLQEPLRNVIQPALAPLAASGLMAAGVAAIAWSLQAVLPTPAVLVIAGGAGAVLYTVVLWLLSPALVRDAFETFRIAIYPMRRG